MSPQAGEILVQQIAPRIRAAVPGCARPVGAEDHEELVQDCIALAAQMLHRVEEIGKVVTPGNIAYYAILHTKSGRRSYGAGRTDAMSPGAQLDATSSVLSLEEEVGYDPETDEAILLGDLLAGNHEDPSMAAARNADWESFIDTHDDRYGVVLKGIAEGRTARETAAANGPGFTRIYQLQNRLAEDVREYMGAEAIADCLCRPPWVATVVAEREKVACRAERTTRQLGVGRRKAKGGQPQ